MTEETPMLIQDRLTPAPPSLAPTRYGTGPVTMTTAPVTMNAAPSYPSQWLQGEFESEVE